MHTFPSSHGMGPPGWHVPPPQRSPTVHALPSLHPCVLFVCVQPVTPHASSVHTLPSSQPGATQPPAQQSCVPVHIGVRSHVAPEHIAAMHIDGSGMHVAPEQAGYWQPSIRSQCPPGIAVHIPSIGTCAQPLDALQLSTVQSSPSLQLSGAPLTQLDMPSHWSPTVHALPSSHASVFGTWTQPPTVSQLSFVHGL